MFSPDEHAIGWSWSSFNRLRIQPGDVGIVSRIKDDSYVYIDDDRGGFSWDCFTRAPDQ